MKISDYLIEFLLEQKIDKVFGYIGGAVAHIYHSIDKYEKMELINFASILAARQQAPWFSATFE